MKFHLAQVNIARAKAPLESDTMSGFVARLDEINALADRSPGFVFTWPCGGCLPVTCRASTKPRNAWHISKNTAQHTSRSRFGLLSRRMNRSRRPRIGRLFGLVWRRE
jgi:hypothetical protein